MPSGGAGNWEAAVAAGAKLERRVEAACDHYRAIGHADIKRTKAQKLRAVRFTLPGVSWVDFEGTLADGRRIAFDAKSLSKVAWLEEPFVHPNQVAYLRRVQQRGGVAFFLVFDKKLDMAWCVMDIQRLALGGRVPIRSVDAGKVYEYHPAVPLHGDIGVDFLPVALREAERQAARSLDLPGAGE